MNINKLLGIMAEKRISQRQLARLLGKSKNTICSKLNGKSNFDTEEVVAICKILDITDNATKGEIFLS